MQFNLNLTLPCYFILLSIYYHINIVLVLLSILNSYVLFDVWQEDQYANTRKYIVFNTKHSTRLAAVVYMVDSFKVLFNLKLTKQSVQDSTYYHQPTR
jgi:hypothetical protein